MHKLTAPGDSANPLSQAVMGFPTLWIQPDDALTSESILNAIRAGRCFISESPAGPQLYVRRERDEIVAHVVSADGDALLAVGPHGTLAAAAIRSSDATLGWPLDALTAGETVPFIRFELHTATGGIRALSNPVWLNE